MNLAHPMLSDIVWPYKILISDSVKNVVQDESGIV